MLSISPGYWFNCLGLSTFSSWSPIRLNLWTANVKGLPHNHTHTHTHVVRYNFHAAHAVAVSATSARRNEIISVHILRSAALNPQIKVSLFGVLLTLFRAAAAKRRLQSALRVTTLIKPGKSLHVRILCNSRGGVHFPYSLLLLLFSAEKGKQYIN